MSADSLIREARRRAGLSQSALALRAGTSQPAVAKLERGQSSPTLTTLQRLVKAAGYDVRFDLVPAPVSDPVVDAYKRDVDRTLIRENLRRSVDDRLRSLAELQELGRELEQSVRPQRRKKP